MSASWRQAALLASALVGSAACSTVSGLRPAELPEERVAVLYRSESAASKRAGAMKDLEERQQGGGGEGLVRLEDLDALFGGTPDATKRVGEPGHLALLDPRSGRAAEVENAPPGARPLAWSPDRRQLLVAGRWRDGMQLFTWDPASGSQEILTSGPREHPQGCFAADGRLVALEIESSGGKQTARLAAAPKGGTGLRPISSGPADAQPACSPTDALIASVTIGADGSPTILVRDLDAPDSNPHPIGRGFNPRFTPDGKWIVYAAKTQQGKRLFRVRPDGSGRTALAVSTQDESEPAVSPDGRYVAYVVEEDHRERLWVRRFDGTGGGRPLLGDGDAVSPAW